MGIIFVKHLGNIFCTLGRATLYALKLRPYIFLFRQWLHESNIVFCVAAKKTSVDLTDEFNFWILESLLS